MHTHLVRGVLHGQFLIIHISFPAGLREAAPQRFPLVKLSHLQGLARRVNLLRFAKTHTSSSSISISLFFFHDLYFQDLSRGSCGKKTRGKVQQCCYRICCLTECRATSDTLQLFCIIQAFSCSFPQSGTPSNIVSVKCVDSLNQKAFPKTTNLMLLCSFSAAINSDF